MLTHAYGTVQIDIAKRHINTVLSLELAKPHERLIQTSCCDGKALFAYMNSLNIHQLMLVERAAEHFSMTSILDGVDGFAYQPPNDVCVSCQEDYTHTRSFFRSLPDAFIFQICTWRLHLLDLYLTPFTSRLTFTYKNYVYIMVCVI